MSTEHCLHCGGRIPFVRDAFCITCGEELDDPPEMARTPEEKEAFRIQVEKDAKQGLSSLAALLHRFGF